MNKQIKEAIRKQRERIAHIHDNKDLIRFIQKNYSDLTPLQKRNVQEEMDELNQSELELTLNITTILYEYTVAYEGKRNKEWLVEQLENVKGIEEQFRKAEDNIHQGIKIDQGIWFIRQMLTLLKFEDSIDELIKSYKYQEKAFDYAKDYRARPGAKMARVLLLQAEHLN